MATRKTPKSMKTATKRTATRKPRRATNLIGKTTRGMENELVSLEVRNVSSEVIREVSYSNGDLTVTMRSGGLYRYRNIDPQLVMEFLAADSYGRFFNQNIKTLPCDRVA